METQDPKKEILSVGTVAEYFNMSKRWVYNHAEDLGGFRIGRSIFFTWEGVQDAIQRGQIVAGNSKAKGDETPNKKVSEVMRRKKMRKRNDFGSQKARKELAERAGFGEFV